MRTRVRTEGAEALQKKFRKVPNRIDKYMRGALQNSIAKIEGDAKRNSPVITGQLRSSVFSQMLSGSRGKVELGAKYGIYVHEGTSPHTISVKNASVLANKRTGQFFGRVVHHPGSKANPFLFDALDDNIGYIKDEFLKAIRHGTT